MEQEKILMGQRELKQWHLMKMAEIKITLKEVSEKITNRLEIISLSCLTIWQKTCCRKKIRDSHKCEEANAPSHS